MPVQLRDVQPGLVHHSCDLSPPARRRTRPLSRRRPALPPQSPSLTAVDPARAVRPEHEPEGRAPRPIASSASCGRVMPQIFTSSFLTGPRLSEIAKRAAGIIGGHQPLAHEERVVAAALRRRRSSAAFRPLSATAMTSSGICSIALWLRRCRRSAFAGCDCSHRRSTRRRRSRSAARPGRELRRAHRGPHRRPRGAVSRARRSSSAATISRTASAPAARASTI